MTFLERRAFKSRHDCNCTGPRYAIVVALAINGNRNFFWSSDSSFLGCMRRHFMGHFCVADVVAVLLATITNERNPVAGILHHK